MTGERVKWFVLTRLIYENAVDTLFLLYEMTSLYLQEKTLVTQLKTA